MWHEFNVKQKKTMGSYTIASVCQFAYEYVHNIADRDAYGFAVRPQHIQTYRQYVNIYKEEEEERSEKWKMFLEHHAKPTELCLSEEEDTKTLQAEATELKNKVCPEEENKETLLVDAHETKEETASEKQHKVALQTETTQLNKDAASEEECKETFQGETIKVKEEVASELKEEAASERSKEGDAPSAKLDYAGSIESETEKPDSAHSTESAREKEVQLAEETKTRKVERWAKTRPTLYGIENMMNSRVKKGKNLKNTNMNESGNHLPSIKEVRSPEGESEDEFEEKVCVNEISAREESNGGSGAYHESFFPWKEELESLVHGGVPKDLRGEVWQAFVGVKARRVERYYEDLLAQENYDDDQHSNSSGVFSKWRKQIEKDLPRTFPGHPALNDHGRDSLRRLLLAYARHNPSVGYCQGMNFFAGLLLLLMPEENAFWTFVGIIDDYFNGYYTEEMIESQVDQLVFEELMRERFPKLGLFTFLHFIYDLPMHYTKQMGDFFYFMYAYGEVNHLDYLGVQVTWISASWFLSIFVNMLPWESVLRIWDVILFEGNRVMLFRTALALMELYGPALVTTKDAGDAITLLQSLAGSTFDSSQLVLTACMGFLAVTDGKLQELREKHRPAVLLIVEERTKGGQVWKDSKGLASKLYSFKHDRGSLQKETKPAEGLADGNTSKLEPRSSNLDELLCSLNADSTVDSLPDLQEQVDWMKVELCRLLEEKRAAVLRAEELETALVELVKEDNQRLLSAKIEQLEQEVTDLHQALADKKEQEAAVIKVLIQLEQEQRIIEDARRNAEQDAAVQRHAVTELQEKYEKAMAYIAQMEKRVVMAESMLEATLQYESGQSKALSSPRAQRDSPRRKVGLLSFALGWRDKNKVNIYIATFWQVLLAKALGLSFLDFYYSFPSGMKYFIQLFWSSSISLK
ncbi:LOW QUALITY PROTEIN: ecotropic viral integration site 5 protein homolog [Durio zibethinus]|uniref:LOW QUALITY PROTEIN: ecotropic viral integration site 5 protein homolog n=1 Tax=Durio zibethinus TaxID=66656 RepID=A0A6P6ALT3_DURZI|nr:LOW QUALITY PROTEIN: ecotropic viral integration site 5 protein homolog [Durio zibethinus]